jgi:hypothetical protein
LAACICSFDILRAFDANGSDQYTNGRGERLRLGNLRLLLLGLKYIADFHLLSNRRVKGPFTPATNIVRQQSIASLERACASLRMQQKNIAVHTQKRCQRSALRWDALQGSI